MNVAITLAVLILSTFSSSILAYGSSSSSKKACAKPTFTQFTPAHLATIAPQAEFSFLASSSTNPDTIDVSVKKQAVNVVINKTKKGYSVVGTLPTSLQGNFARVNISATGTNNCVGNDGWLLKIEE